jgi:hypothetical protein
MAASNASIVEGSPSLNTEHGSPPEHVQVIVAPYDVLPISSGGHARQKPSMVEAHLYPDSTSDLCTYSNTREYLIHS